MTINADTRTDSHEGIAHFMKWAAAHHIVLSIAHRKIAEKHGVDVSGVTFSNLLPHVAMVDRLPT